jgi:hypothetical protein
VPRAHDAIEIAFDERDLRALHGNVGPGAHGDADIRASQRRCVIDPVTGHGDPTAFALQPFDDPRFVRWLNLGNDFVESLMESPTATTAASVPSIARNITVRPVARMASTPHAKHRPTRRHLSSAPHCERDGLRAEAATNPTPGDRLIFRKSRKISRGARSRRRYGNNYGGIPVHLRCSKSVPAEITFRLETDVTIWATRPRNARENWRSEAKKHMFAHVNRRLLRSLVYLLVLGQVLLSAPVTAALATTGSAAATEMPCADSMPQTDPSKPCPCCPDGTTGVAACLSACMGSVAELSTLTVQPIRAAAQAPVSVATMPAARVADPPLKPPPIV